MRNHFMLKACGYSIRQRYPGRKNKNYRKEDSTGKGHS